ncbi:MAG: diacylglycerol kinase family lipid kinase [Verrucomicrobia bacterium]|nr:diacylglycerol kinase family lipid kinase [Verrucomicrobiota bacterium]MBI3868866.1 diacylglycerol kinase family lipid kinase [Verrucomicrobiota bacterium]
MAKTCVIFNPAARGEKALAFQEKLRALSDRFTLRPTDAPGAARRLAREAVAEGFERVIAAGGDGTVNEAANGLLDGESAGVDVALGVIPLGTVNVFAKEIGVPSRVPEALRIVEAGRSRLIDAPLATFRSDSRQEEARAFLQLAGAGLDARAIARVRWDLKKRMGPLAYIVAGFEALRESVAPIEVESAERSAVGPLVLIGNGRFYGGRFQVFPGADLGDGWLDVAVFPEAGLGALTRFGLGWLTGNVHRWTGAIAWRTKRLALRCADPMPMELEGDNVGFLPAEIRITGRRLRVLVP